MKLPALDVGFLPGAAVSGVCRLCEAPIALGRSGLYSGSANTWGAVQNTSVLHVVPNLRTALAVGPYRWR